MIHTHVLCTYVCKIARYTLTCYAPLIFTAIFVQCYLFVSMPTSFVVLILVKKSLTGYHRNVSYFTIQ